MRGGCPQQTSAAALQPGSGISDSTAWPLLRLPMNASPQSIPGPRPAVVFAWQLGLIQFARQPIRFMQTLHHQYGELVRVGEGTRLESTFGFGPRYNRIFLSNPRLFFSYDLSSMPFPFPKEGPLVRMTSALALMNGEHHRAQRRLMMPAFHRQRLDRYSREIVEITCRRAQTWQPGQPIDLYVEMEQLSIEIVLRILLGVQSVSDSLRLGALFENAMQRLFSIPTLLFPYQIPGLPYQRFLAGLSQLEAEIRAVIERRRQTGEDAGDALSMLIETHDEDGKRLNDDELIGQTVALFRGGYKTTASALNWIFFLLSQHPQIYADLVDEVEGLDPWNAPGVQQIMQQPLLEAVIKEAMRLIPPVIWGSRFSTQAIELDSYCLPAGSRVVYSAQITHRFPEIYPRPDEFLPRRWEDLDPSPYEYLPFSAGPRLCLGAGFAMMTMKIVLAILVQRHRFQLQPAARIDREGIIGSLPRFGMPMRVYPQDRKFQKSDFRGNIRQLVQIPRPVGYRNS